MGAADVSVEFVGNELVFYTYGELLGFNLYAEDVHAELGVPEFLAGGEGRQDSEGFLSAVNISETTYSIGFCSTTSPSDGTPVLKIPVRQSGSVTFRLLVNSEAKDVTVDATTGVGDAEHDRLVVYPNPAKDHLFIHTGIFGITDSYRMKIMSQLGATVFETEIEQGEYMIDLSNWPGAGIYYLQMTDRKGAVVATQKILLQ